jgi:hypothetical protein
MKLTTRLLPLAAAFFAALTSPSHAQTRPTTTEPQTPPARSFHDPRSGITFQVPAGWNLTRKDGDVSTFNLDARSTSKATRLSAVANITFNPFPRSTFAGAYFYASLTPHLSDADCSHQASVLNSRPTTTNPVASIPFTHGYDEHGGVCTESRDEIYTAPHHGACYRFDLVINNFCGGEVSGVKDISPQELESVRKRLESILATVQFDK